MSKLKKAPKQDQHQPKSRVPLPIKWGAVVLIIALLIPAVSYVMKPKVEEKKTVDPLTQYQFSKEGDLTFFSANGDSLTKIDIELATNDQERALGLMNRTYMKENQGMLFLFDVEEPQSFWMKNTYISLDMLFINSHNEIIKIHKNTAVLTEDPYASEAPAQFVLEVNGGFTDKYHVKEGDRIQFRKY